MLIPSRRARSHDGDDAAGWIAMTDLFSLFAVVAIGIGAAQIAKLSKQLSTMPGDWTSVVREHAEFRARLSALEGELTALRSERDQLREERAKLADELRLTMDVLAKERDANAALRSKVERLTDLLKDSERRLAALADVEGRIRRLEQELQDAAAPIATAPGVMENSRHRSCSRKEKSTAATATTRRG